MGPIPLTTLDLALASVLVILVAASSYYGRLAISKPLLIGGVRTAVQLILIGLVLEALFAFGRLHWVVLMAMVMLLFAGREVVARQKRRFAGWWGFGLGTLAMFMSSFTVTVLALVAIIGPEPWYRPQYAIPLLGMLLGNTMSGVALALERLTQGAWQQRAVIEARLMLGQRWREAIGDVRREAMRSGMIPTVSGMATAGVVSLPGMMTGQILSGVAPIEAVKYQILVIFLIAAGTGFGTQLAVGIGSRRLFDDRERLRLDRLKGDA
jgi:putative ABC transport system permease protein